MGGGEWVLYGWSHSLPYVSNYVTLPHVVIYLSLLVVNKVPYPTCVGTVDF